MDDVEGYEGVNPWYLDFEGFQTSQLVQYKLSIMRAINSRSMGQQSFQVFQHALSYVVSLEPWSDDRLIPRLRCLTAMVWRLTESDPDRLQQVCSDVSRRLYQEGFRVRVFRGRFRFFGPVPPAPAA